LVASALIAFSSSAGDQNDEIYIMKFDGSGLFRVTNDPLIFGGL
jgi:hypothetical protein